MSIRVDKAMVSLVWAAISHDAGYLKSDLSLTSCGEGAEHYTVSTTPASGANGQNHVAFSIPLLAP